MDEEELTEEQKEDIKETTENPESAKQLNEDSYSEETPNVATPSTQAILRYLMGKKILIGLFAAMIGFIFLILFFQVLKSQDFYFFGPHDEQEYGDGDDILEPISAPISNCNGLVYLVWENPEYTKLHKEDEDYEVITDPSLVDLEENEEQRFLFEEAFLNDYLLGMVWNIASNTKHMEVYKAVAIAARSHLAITVPENCVILKEYNDNNYVEVESYEPEYSNILEAIRNTGGEVIVKDEEILDAKYDTFCWVKKSREAESFYYILTQTNKEGSQVIPNSFVEENNINLDCVETEYKRFEKLSIWGSKYLFEKKTNAYDLLRVLKYYYGEEIVLKTINEGGFFGDLGRCSDIAMSSTVLTKEEFVAKVRASSARGVMKENAEEIYDVSLANGVNPELVIIRAEVEGYSPGASYNNYWGIGCTNKGGISSCSRFRTFSEGLISFLKIVSKYSTLAEFGSRYAYLGDYWYNPGSWSIGGCKYKDYIFDVIPERVQRACGANSPSCTLDDTSNCTTTTPEERLAYAAYQSKDMIDTRQTIFGLSKDACESESLGTSTSYGNETCRLFAQGNMLWGMIRLGQSSTNMSSSGCAVTSVAMALTCSGLSLPSGFNPRTLVADLNKNNGFDNSGFIYWGNSAITKYGFSYQERTSLKGKTANDKMNSIVAKKNDHTQVILHIQEGTKEHARGHYVVYAGVSSGRIITLDPSGGVETSWDPSVFDTMIVYSY